MEITKEDVEKRASYKPKRICFGNDPYAKHRRPKTFIGHEEKYPHGVIQWPFKKGHLNCFPQKLLRSQTKDSAPEAVWRAFQSTAEGQSAEEWCDQCGDMVFLYDCLDASVALGYTFQREKDRRTRTEIGSLEHSAKHSQDIGSIDQIAARMADVVTRFQPYNHADLICGVPAQQGKEFHLPARLAEKIAGQIKRSDITADFSFSKDKPSLKDTAIEEKWDALANVEFLTQDNPTSLKGKSIILVDDKYQSGITLQYVASRLLKKGASKVFGLCAVKTWRDDDNTS